MISFKTLSLQLVMEYCLGSASDLLEGELKTYYLRHVAVGLQRTNMSCLLF